jgi:beta-glucosidase-like glycosyl hydrolase/CubicO group peptidase (beta-lactamase class C family)
MDAEWGPSMRLDSLPRFPRNMTLGALAPQYDTLIYEMGREIGLQCKALGVHVNYAPVIDVNNNSKNPVINSRSFGENKNWVVRKGLAYMNGLRSTQTVPCAKHFPGHGDTEVDSHFGLPVILKSKQELVETELFPFTKFIEQNVEMIMISHLNIPALDSTKNSIATLSYPIVTDLLKNEMGYKGIIVSDGMEMEGLRKFYKNGAEAEILCLLAGVDQLCLPNDMSIIIPEIKKAVENGIITEAQINEKCLKILKLKEDLGLTHFTPLSYQIEPILYSEKTNELIRKIETKALTLLTNDGIIPITTTTKTAVLIIGDYETNDFCSKICKEIKIPYFLLGKEIKQSESQKIIENLMGYQNVIVVYINTNQSPARQYGITPESVKFLEHLSKSKKVILALFGNPYALEQFKKVDHFSAVIIGYQRTQMSVKAALEGVFGKLRFEGFLPVSTLHFKSGTNYYSNTSSKENTSLLSKMEGQILDSIALSGIKNKYYPGCQVLAIKNGITIFKKNYGFTSYDEKIPVGEKTLYDIASISKIASTTLALMKLYEEGKIGLKDPVEKYLPFFSGSSVGKLKIDELLTHTSGLPAFIPFYNKLNGDSIRYLYINDIQNETFTLPVANGFFLHKDFPQIILTEIKNVKLNSKKYNYSDLGFIILKEIVESVTQTPIDQYVTDNFYKPLGMFNTMFNPIAYNVDIQRIAPTENDNLFRMQTVQGYVHDQTAALFGGIQGHAGLFSTTEDLGILFTMLLKGGEYNGKRYFKESTVKLFTSSYAINNCAIRGLGFFTPSHLEQSDILPKKSSSLTYGHQGFTGTVVWVDPKENLIYIFLSNRVHPNTEPNNLSKSKIRLILHEKIYDFLK